MDGVRVESLDDPGGEVLADLRLWLRTDLPRLRVTTVRHPSRPGEMNDGVLAALETAALSPEVLAALIAAVGGWLAARATTRRTRIRVRRGDREIEIDTADAPKADEIARRLDREIGGE